MPDYQSIASNLIDQLALTIPPITVSVVSSMPDGIPAFAGTAAAGCQFWEKAATGAFVTSTPDHELCAIGVHTHQMADPSEACQKELGDALGVFQELTYVRSDDVPRVPVMSQPSKYVVYAPLAQSPVSPDVVLLFANASRSLVITEAVEQVESGIPPALGRPACAAIPQAINTGRAALSLGCCGARAYLDGLRDDIAMWAIPGAQIETYAERIGALTNANDILTKFHSTRRTDIEAGGRPTLQESLDRIS